MAYDFSYSMSSPAVSFVNTGGKAQFKGGLEVAGENINDKSKYKIWCRLSHAVKYSYGYAVTVYLQYYDNGSWQTYGSGVTATKTDTKLEDSWNWYYQTNWFDYEFTRQETAQTYAYRVVAYCNGHWSVPSNYITFTIPSLPSYEITYNSNGGTRAPAKQVKYYNKNLTLSSQQPIKSNISDPKTITLNPNGGNLSSNTIDVNNEIEYPFSIWKDRGAGSIENPTGLTYEPGVNYTANAALTLIAQWNENTILEEVKSLPTPTFTGHIFDGWYTAAENGTEISLPCTVENDVTFYAHWSLEQYDIIYNFNGGTGGPSNQIKTYGDNNFKLSSTTPTKDNTSEYRTITFNPNGGVISSGNESITITNTIEHPFNSWKGSDGHTYQRNGSYTGNQSLTLTAQWSNRTTRGQIGDLPVATRSGYRFDGWYTDIDGGRQIQTTSTFSASTTVYAHWTPLTYTIEYDLTSLINLDSLYTISWGNLETERVIQSIELSSNALIPEIIPKVTIENSASYKVQFVYNTNDILTEEHDINQIVRFMGWGPQNCAEPLYYPHTIAEALGEEPAVNTTYTLYAYWNGDPEIGITLPQPKLPGKIFDGWYYDNETFESSADNDVDPNNNLWNYSGEVEGQDTTIILYAKWKDIIYKINYFTNGGEPLREGINIERTYSDFPLRITDYPPSKKTITPEEPNIITFYSPEKNTLNQFEEFEEFEQRFKIGNKYSFVEWNTESGGQGRSYAPDSQWLFSEIEERQEPLEVEVLNLYAQWEPQPQLYVYNGETYQESDVGIYLPTPNLQEGKIFDEWKISEENTRTLNQKSNSFYAPSAAVNVSIETVWHWATYNVLYDPNGGMEEQTPTKQIKTYGQSLTLAPGMTKEDYLEGPYTVRFYYNNTNISNQAEADVVIDNIQPLTQYNFKEWNTNKRGNGISYNARGIYETNSDVLLYAQWTEIYDMENAGCFIQLNNYEPQAPTGYDFAGWYKDRDCTVALIPTHETIYIPRGNISIYAKWEIKKYTVTYHANMGDENTVPNPQQFAYNQGVKLSKVVPSRLDWVFDHWNTEPNNTGLVDYLPEDIISNINENIDLYAQWREVHTLTEWLTTWETTCANMEDDIAGNDLKLWDTEYTSSSELFDAITETINNVSTTKHLLGKGYKLRLDLINPYGNNKNNKPERLSRTIFVPTNGHYQVPEEVEIAEIYLFDGATANINYQANLNLNHISSDIPKSYKVIEQVVGQITETIYPNQDIGLILKSKYAVNDNINEIRIENALDSWTEMIIRPTNANPTFNVYRVGNQEYTACTANEINPTWEIEKCILTGSNPIECTINYKANIVQKTYY